METTQPSQAERVEKALQLIESEHLSFRRSCELAGINKGDAWRVMQGDLTLATRYARARECRGVVHGDDIAEMGEKVVRGEIPPDVARVALDAMKWAAARMAPKFCGDKVTQEHTGPNGGPVQVEEIRRTVVDPTPE